jgi:hypothetical protein
MRRIVIESGVNSIPNSVYLLLLVQTHLQYGHWQEPGQAHVQNKEKWCELYDPWTGTKTRTVTRMGITTADEATLSVVLQDINLMKWLFAFKILHLNAEATWSLPNVNFYCDNSTTCLKSPKFSIVRQCRIIESWWEDYFVRILANTGGGRVSPSLYFKFA